ncbi:TonB-dependent receptor [Glacieibacterium sp.]|uniref:TonB-dependent receptor n=1 Tax=Glacieibacterium sp. TaxID=2860237 RepID=UPI003AFFD019
MRGRRHVRAIRGLASLGLLIVTAAGALPRIDLPAGTLGSAVTALGTQAGVSISIADATLWSQPVPAVHGRLTVAAALARLTRGTAARVLVIDGVTWRIERAARPARVPAATPPIHRLAPSEEEPIIVIASKRDVRLGDFPGTVLRLDGDDLGLGGTQGTGGILAQTASVSSTHLGEGRNKLFIRGIADSSFTGPTQATVGQYFGDVRLTYNAPDPDLRLYDVAAVEVLEGPQATLYGAGSLGGIIRVVRNPARLGEIEAALSAGVALTQHGAPGADFGGVVNLPLLDTRVALRIVGYGLTDGGYIDDVERGKSNINRTRTAGGRAALGIDAGDDWTIDAGATFQAIHGDDSQYADRDGPPLTHASPIAQGFRASYALADFVVGKDWGELRLLSSSGIARQSLDERFDAGSNQPLNIAAGQSLAPVLAAATFGDSGRVFTQANRTMLVSNETRLWRPMSRAFGWVVGTSLLYNRSRLRRTLGQIGMPLPVTGVVNRIDEATLFGEASYQPLPALTLTAGGRVSRSKLSGDGEDIEPTASRLVALARAQATASRTSTRVLPSISAAATMLPGVILFTRYNQGFRPGGLSIDSDFVRRFNSDRVATLETGVRSGNPGHGAFDLAAAVALTRWTRIQADFVDGNGLPTTANIGDGRITSLSLTGGWRPVGGLSLDAELVLNDSRVTDPKVVMLAGIPLTRIPNVSRLTARAGLDYRTRLSDALDLRVRASARYTGKSRLGVGPFLGQEQGDYVDTSLTARIGCPGLGLTLTLTNLADSAGNRFALGTPYQALQEGQITPLRPRTVRLGIDTRF